MTLRCGFCNTIVPEENLDTHNCEIINSIKNDLNDSLRTIQHDFKSTLETEVDTWNIRFDKFDNLYGSRLDGVDVRLDKFEQARDSWHTGFEYRFNNLIYELHDWKNKIVKKVDSSVSLDIVYNEINIREAWQNSCVFRLNNLSERISDLEKMIKLVGPSVDQPPYLKIEILMDCLDRKSNELENLKKEYEEANISYIKTIKEQQSVIALQNIEIHNLKNPISNTGNCT